MKITHSSKALMFYFANAAGDWDGSPMLDIRERQKGNLTDLKRKGFVTTAKDTDNPQTTWVKFTEAGLDYIKNEFNMSQEDLGLYA